MTVKLLHSTPLYIASIAIRKCWASEGNSDTEFEVCGPKDKELIHRVGNKNKHASTLEHINYSFDIDGISRACLQEVARHRMTSYSVKSTRYTLKELKEAEDVDDFFVHTGDFYVDLQIQNALRGTQGLLQQGISNDKLKYSLPEAYKTSLVMTINARSLQNFLALRTNKAALWEIRELAYEIYKQLPEEHKYLFSEFIYKETADV